jgi:hypothetical protein
MAFEMSESNEFAVCVIVPPNTQESTGQMIITVFGKIREETEMTKRQWYVENLSIGENQL